MALRQLRLVQQVIAHARELAVLALPAAAVVAPVIGLRPQRHGLGVLLGLHAVVAQHDHAGDAMLPRCLQIAVEALHEAVVLLVPDEELENDADAVEAGLRGQRQLLVRDFEALLKALLLPLVNAVRAVAAHEVAAAQPVVVVIPGPRALPAPDFTHAMFRLPFVRSLMMGKVSKSTCFNYTDCRKASQPARRKRSISETESQNRRSPQRGVSSSGVSLRWLLRNCEGLCPMVMRNIRLK